jgi:porin
LPGDSDLIGNYKAGVWRDTSSYTDYDTLGYGRTPDGKRGNWGCYGLFDQVLVPFGEKGSDRGFGVFGSLMISPNETISQMPYFFTAGVAARGIVPSRDTDTTGFGVVFGEFSRDLRHAKEREMMLVPTTDVQKSETVLEWTYRFYFHKASLFYQPDIQYIIRPGGSGKIGNALVVGSQIGFDF